MPNAYVAVRFAFGPAFPDTPANQRAARATVETLAAAQPVVLLNMGFSLDGLDELDPGPLANVWRIDTAATPATGLLVQSAVVGRASRFVGTFGSLACLAVAYGVPARTIYSDTSGATPALLDAMRRTAAALRTEAVPLHVRDLEASTHGGALASRSEAIFSGTE